MSTSIMRNPDEEHLRLLAIFHYVLAGMNALAGCFGLMYVAFGIAMMVGKLDQGRNGPPPEFGLLVALLGGSFSLFFWGLAIAKLLAARWLGQRSHYRFCFVVACIECANMPMGTVLGVFTILVLTRPSVKALFDGIPYHDPRVAALDEFGDDDPPRPPDGPDDLFTSRKR